MPSIRWALREVRLVKIRIAMIVCHPLKNCSSFGRGLAAKVNADKRELCGPVPSGHFCPQVSYRIKY